MARVKLVGHVRGMLASVLLGGCFSSEVLAGSPCDGEHPCGKELACIDSFCKPADCAGDPDCAPFKRACGGEADVDCADVGASGCFFVEEDPAAGYCALSCERADQCPADGTAQPDCIDSPTAGAAVARVCALDCGGGRTCPSYMHCADVTLADGSRSLCLSGAPAGAEQP